MTPNRDPRWQHLHGAITKAHADRAALVGRAGTAAIPHLDDAGANWRDLLDDFDLQALNDDDLYPFVAGLLAFYLLATELTPGIEPALQRVVDVSLTGLTDYLPTP